jgi:hypothetical protein
MVKNSRILEKQTILKNTTQDWTVWALKSYLGSTIKNTAKPRFAIGMTR